MFKKLNSFIGLVILITVLAFGGVMFYAYMERNDFLPEENMYFRSAEYIDPEKALGDKNFSVCDEDFIIQYYNPDRARYSEGKNGLRQHIRSRYKNKGYSDSGYLNIRFVINCKGEAGRYLIHQNDLNLNPTKLDPNMVDQLFDITTELKTWHPNYTHDAYRDSYMYISYRIEHGNITEILP